MSLRARLEEERAIQAQIDFEAEEERLEAIKRRIHEPIIWETFADGIRVQDLTLDLQEEVLEIIQEDYVREEVLCRNLVIHEDETSMASFMSRIEFCLKDKKSIVAIDTEKEDAIVGFMLLKSVPKAHFGRVFSRVIFTEGRVMEEIMDFLNSLNRNVEIYDDFECDNFLRYYLVHVLPDYRKRDVPFKLFTAAFDVARSLDIPVVMGIFSTYNLQYVADKFGMKMLKEIPYISWIKNEKLVFCDPGPGNYSCALMAGVVPPPPEPEPPPPPTKEEVETEKKMTREEKRIKKLKKIIAQEKQLNIN